jgi:hypothetical protein
MTVLGKILAILNLLLSLAVGAFIIMTYAARTNWHDATLKWEQRAKDEHAAANAYQNEVTQVTGELARTKTDLGKQIADVEQKLKFQMTQFAQEQKKLAASDNKNQELLALTKKLTEEHDRFQREVEYARGLVAKRDEQLKKYEKDNEDMRASMVDAKIAWKEEQDRNNRLVEELERLSKVAQKAEQSNGSKVATATGMRPKSRPPNDVEGLVKKTDADSGYVTITLGSDAEISRGNTLEVYRLKPQPVYIGTIEVVAVRPTEAVAKPLGRLRGTIQVGDQVSSNIIRR